MTIYNETPVPRPAATPNKPNPPRKRRPLGWVDHHIVGSLPGCTATFQNPETGYATNYGIGSGDGRGGGGWWIHEYVPADHVAWGNGNTFLNEHGVSVEHENNLAVGIAAKPVHEVHELSARFMAALAIRYDWRIDGKVQLVVRDFPNHDFYGKTVPGFGTEFNVITHRSVALKDCPRDLDIYWKAARANEIIAAGGTAGLGYDPLEIKVKHYHFEDRSTREIAPGKDSFLRNSAGAIAGIVGEPGVYSITPHFYAEGTPGDQVDLILEWVQKSPVRISPHYVERLTIGPDGTIRATREFKRAVADGYTVRLRVAAAPTNQGPVRHTIIDSDAFLYTVA